MSEMLYNPYDLIIIKDNVIPQENIEEIMLLTNNTKDISHATTINSDDKEKQDTNLEVRNTLWYNILRKWGKTLNRLLLVVLGNT